MQSIEKSLRNMVVKLEGNEDQGEALSYALHDLFF